MRFKYAYREEFVLYARKCVELILRANGIRTEDSLFAAEYVIKRERVSLLFNAARTCSPAA